MNDALEPTPEFLAHMERETLYVLRRPAPRGRGPLLRHLRTAALVVLALGAGAGCVVVAERVQDSQRVERELARNQIQVELAERRLEALKARTEIARLRHAEGVAPQREVIEAERRQLAAERTLRHLRLDREELEAGGSAFPRGAAIDSELELDLTAPPVHGRDFVSEHLRVERESCAAELEHARGELERANVLHGAGRVPESVPSNARAEVETLERRLASLDQRLANRRDFLAGLKSRERCELTDLRCVAELRRADARAHVRRLRDDLALAEQLHSAGVAPAPDDLRLQLEEARFEIELVWLELEALGVPSKTHTVLDDQGLMQLGY